jgi:hypothetical protein
MSRRPASARGSQGYILMFVLGVLILLGIIALAIAIQQRISTQLVINAKETTQHDLLLRSALQYTQAQLLKAVAVKPLVDAKDNSADGIELWKPGQRYNISIGGQPINILLESQPEPPDLNLMTEIEIERLFVALGTGGDEGKRYAKALLAIKPANGFLNISQALGVAEIPAPLRFGFKVQPGGEVVPGVPTRDIIGLRDLLSVGSKQKNIDANTSPLPVIAALTGASIDKLAELDSARQRNKKLSLDDAALLLGESVRKLTGLGNSVRATLWIDNKGVGATARLKAGGNTGGWDVQEYRLQQPFTPPSDTIDPDSISRPATEGRL